jgi:DNA-binding MarR family transcriptional regulator
MQLPARSASEIMGVLDDLRRIVRALRQASRSAQQRLGVTGAQLFVLQALSAREPASIGALAQRTRTHQSTVSVVVKRLVNGGLVRRAPAANDGRSVELALTARGRTLLRHAPLAAQETLIGGLERLSPAERRALASALHRLVQAMRLGDEAPEMFFEESARRAMRRPARGQ